MGDGGGASRLPGNLDPGAEEFRPRNQHHQSPPQIFYPYFSSTDLRVLPFCPTLQFPTPPAYFSPSPPPIPPPAAPTRALLLTSVPVGASETTVRSELEVFGDVRAVQMERAYEGIVTVHFYDLRNAQEAMAAVRDQHMQQERSRLRHRFDGAVSVAEPVARGGLLVGGAAWAQFVIPAARAFPDGHNQGTLVVFNLDSSVTASRVKQIFEAFGPVKELRETPLKKHQRFVEFFDVRDAARALREMNGKRVNGRNVVVEFSRPGGGHGRNLCNAVTTTSNVTSPKSCSNSNRTSNSLPSTTYGASRFPPQPPPPCEELAGRFSGNMFRHPGKSGAKEGSNVIKRSARSGGVEGSVATLSLSSCNKVGGCNNPPSAMSPLPPLAETAPAVAPPRSRTVKGRRKNVETRFLINNEAAEESGTGDSRTTVMIKNIPNKYSLKLLMNMLDNHCIHCNEQIPDGVEDDNDHPLSAYDFIYLPIDFNNKCNVGYGFVNLTTPQAAWRLYKAFHLQPWKVFNSRKICEVTYARLQGLEALKEHFRSSKFGSVAAVEYLPAVFAPPRDGKQLTEPLSIGGRASNNQVIAAGGGGDERPDDVDGGDDGEGGGGGSY